MSDRFRWLAFAKDFGALTLSFASGAPTVVIALWFYLQGREQPRSGLLTVLMIFSILAAWIQWWKEHKAHKQDMAQLTKQYEGSLSAKNRDWNGDWLALETKFMNYDSPIIAVCDLYYGNESWRLQTAKPDGYTRDFQQLCNSGVALLRTSSGVPARYVEMARANPGDYTLWLSFVRHLYGPEIEMKIADGKGVTSIVQIKDVRKVSAMACQHCAANSL